MARWYTKPSLLEYPHRKSIYKNKYKSSGFHTRNRTAFTILKWVCVVKLVKKLIALTGQLYTVCISTVFNVSNDTKMTQFLSLLTHYIQVFFIVFNVFKDMEIDMLTGKDTTLKFSVEVYSFQTKLQG